MVSQSTFIVYSPKKESDNGTLENYTGVGFFEEGLLERAKANNGVAQKVKALRY
ncbi:hypothetical protein M9782_05310 [Pectobacterium actinidiae]|uniref:hypothetical protein n=1 Tax=Pectobacterium actinidiae TaxID=1507808 RepID=UPI0023AA8009|nr:hypothetical protein [Pectobacterium actinidiae]WEF12708.1 hypothetical protein M9782_05310 [Pectobacterium actinidiae]